MKMEMHMIQALNSALKTAMEKDDKVIVLGEDVGRDGGVFRTTDKLQEQFGEERVMDTPLAELGIVGHTIGLAVSGMKPVCEIQFSGFIYGGFEQLISHASRIRTRSRGRYTVPMVLRTPYSGGIRALEHHSESMEALYAHIPGLKVVIPSNPYEAKGLLISAIKDPDPVIFLEPKRVYRSIKMEVPEEEYTIPLGKANVAQEGDRVTVITWGAMMKETKEAIERVKDRYSIELIDLRTISPIDTETITESVKKTGRCVIVHEAPRSFGPAAEIIARINEKALMYLEAPIERVTGFDTIMPLYKSEKLYMPDPERIVQAIEKVVEF